MKYCSKCGAEMLKKKVGAEKFSIIAGYPLSIDYPEYNSVTGERNYAWHYFCPNRSRFLGGIFNSHDSFGVIISPEPKMNKGKWGTKT